MPVGNIQGKEVTEYSSAIVALYFQGGFRNLSKRQRGQGATEHKMIPTSGLTTS